MIRFSSLTYEYANESLSYDPDTGLLTWKERPISHFSHCKQPELQQKAQNTRKAGKTAGATNSRGYITLEVRRKYFLGHRVAWLLYFGTWPELQIDHINGIPSDNRIVNLRLATPAQNCANRKRNQDRASGLRGVSQRGNRWYAYVTHKKKRIYLGAAKTELEAYDLYKKGAYDVYGEFARYD
jgi:hypothetical protein